MTEESLAYWKVRALAAETTLAERTKERDSAVRSRERTTDFYAVRYQLLSVECREKGHIAGDVYWNVVANGSRSVHEAPSYWQRLNSLHYEIEQLQESLARAKAFAKIERKES